MDYQEARTLAMLYLSENSLPRLYDSVIIPALTMAEQDRHKGALDPAREEFLFLSIREMLVEFSEMTVKADAAADATPGAPGNQKASSGRIFCIPASDEADEIVAVMLAHLLEQAGCAAVSFPLDPTLQDAIALMSPGDDDTFCISSLPPFAFARARALNRQLRVRFPRTRMIVGVWGFGGDIELALERFQPSRPDKLATGLAEAVSFFVETDPAAIPADAIGQARAST